MKTLISIQDITKKFFSSKGETDVINNISFDLYENEIVALLGPSGCGKSTLLNILSKLENVTSGKVNINCKLGYMFQKDNLMDWRNIYNNITLGLEINHLKTKENLEYVDSLLKKYDLYDFKNYYPQELSGGMRQRISLIRTLALKPDLLLLDEPFSALDYQTKLFVQNDVYNIIKKEQKAALIVTHDISEAIALSDKIIILSNRPCKIKKIFTLDFDKNLTPFQRRTTPTFNKYFKQIHYELNK